MSSFFYKFADTILKKYSSTMATIFTALMSWAAFGHALTMNFLIGVSIVFVSMHQFFTFGDKAADAGKAGHKGSDGGKPQAAMLYSPSMEHIRLPDENGLPHAPPEERAPLLPR